MSTYTAAQVASHNTEKDAWVIINNKVYDVTNFLSQHPGGKNILLKHAGSDITKQFEKFHNAAEVIAKVPDSSSFAVSSLQLDL